MRPPRPVEDAGVGGEYQFAGTAWSLTGGYKHSDSDDLDLTADTVKVGARFNFGGDSKARDRSGADLDGVTDLFGAPRSSTSPGSRRDLRGV